MSDEPIRIEYFSDVLCIWAYMAQIKLDNLKVEFGERVLISHRYMSLFGNNRVRIGQGFTDGAGGFQGYSEHVRNVVAQFAHAQVHPEVWLKNIPTSSLPAHLAIKAVQNLELCGDISPHASGKACAEGYAGRLREAFFMELRDISDHGVLLQEADGLGLPTDGIERELRSGQAHAALSLDLQDQRDKLLEGSPTFILNEGRQKLYGNIGYRAIAANIQEMLDKPVDVPQWC